MTDFFRWQWMWKSRPRLIGIAVGAMALAGLAVLYALTRPGPMSRGQMFIVCGGLMFALLGGYQLLQGLFSPAGSFGNHDAPDPALRTTPKQKRRRKPARPD